MPLLMPRRVQPLLSSCYNLYCYAFEEGFSPNQLLGLGVPCCYGYIKTQIHSRVHSSLQKGLFFGQIPKNRRI